MPRIQPIDPAAATGRTAALLDTTRAMLGGTPNMFTTAANAPAALDAMVGLFGSLSKSSLGAKVGELIAIAVAQANHCGYCLSAHTALGGSFGVDPVALTGARRAVSSDAKTEAILQLAVTIVERRGQIDDETFARARGAGISDAEIVEVVAYVGLNTYTNYLNNVCQTVIDFPTIALDAAA
ncbi:MAG: carboxymuconolactone decarboxylase family protein [bacterium]